MPRAKVQKEEENIVIERVPKSMMIVPIIGITPLIMNRLPDSARQSLLNNRLNLPQPKKVAIDPEEMYQQSLHKFAKSEQGQQRYGFPVGGFKAAIISASRNYKGITKVGLKTSFFVEGDGQDETRTEELVEIRNPEGPRLRADFAVLNNMGKKVPDPRFRAQFDNWTAELYVSYSANMFSADQIVALIDAGGDCGVGDWRPSSPNSETGTYGRWRVAEDAVITEATYDDLRKRRGLL